MTHFGDLPTAALAAHILELGIPDSPSGMIRNLAPMWPHRGVPALCFAPAGITRLGVCSSTISSFDFAFLASRPKHARGLCARQVAGTDCREA